MQRLSIRLLVALITFCFGVVIATVWITLQTPQLDPPQLVLEAPAPDWQWRCFPGRSQRIDQLNRAEGGYFPEEVFFGDPKLSKSVVTVYTNKLKQFNEPTLLDGGHTGYRFLYLRSFHPAIAVRIWVDGEEKRLSVKAMSRHNNDQLATMVARPMTPHEWATFSKLLADSCLWEMPVTSDAPIAFDGAWWVFEGAHENHYHVTHQQSPQSGLYRELCLYLLKLSGLPLDESKDEIY